MIEFDKDRGEDSQSGSSENIPDSNSIFFGDGQPDKDKSSSGNDNCDLWQCYSDREVARQNKYKKIVIAIIAAVLTITVILSAGALGWWLGRSQREMPLTDAIYELINQYYYKDIDKEEYDKYAAMGLSTIMDAYSGMIITDSSLPEPKYGLSMTSDAYNNHYITRVDSMSGSGRAVGYEVVPDGNIIPNTEIKWSVKPDSTVVGMQRGDEIISVNEIIVKGIDNELLSAKGLMGNFVSQIIVRKNDGSYYLFDNVEKSYYNSDIAGYYDLGGGVSMIQLYTFSANNVQDFELAAQEFMRSSNQKLILDLRGNGGGSTTNLSTVAAYLLDKRGENRLPINRVSDKYGNESVYFTDKETDSKYFVGRDKPEYQLAVLMDAGSASASEALIGALKYYQPNTIFVGSETYGKGIAQRDFEVPGYSNILMHITVGYFDVPVSDGKGGYQWANFHEKPYEPTVGCEVKAVNRYDLSCDYAYYYNNNPLAEKAVQKAVEILT